MVSLAKPLMNIATAPRPFPSDLHCVRNPAGFFGLEIINRGLCSLRISNGFGGSFIRFTVRRLVDIILGVATHQLQINIPQS